MKRLLIKIFIMMLVSMGIVFIISRMALYVMQSFGVIDPKNIYNISLLSGFCGLILFAILLNVFLIRRLNRLSAGVKEISKGNYDISIKDKGFDEIETLIKSFNLMAEELKANELLSNDFVKNISHEMKTPLSSILGYAELLSNSQILPQDKQKYTDIIKDEAKRLLTLSSKMLQISGLDAHVFLPKDDIFNPAEQIRTCILSLQNEWQEKNIILNIELQEFKMKGNENLTYLIWLNLVSNAIRYCDEEGVIDVMLEKSNNLCFKIKNTGEGIPTESLQTIFQQFYTLDDSRNKKGTGLGLPLTKKIIDKLGGSIKVESDANKTIFTVVLEF